jgi:O-antigen/teichoic acid export membrane protein
MAFAFVPLYIKFLGIEAFGLIGFFALLQNWLSLLDMGMTTTLGREMARFTGGGHSACSIRNLLRSIEVVAITVAIVVLLGIAVGAEWLATSWVKSEKIAYTEVVNAITVMGLVIAARFVESVYRSSIIGLQRQVLLNTVNSSMATIRGVGAVVILGWVSPTLHAYFLWQGLISIVTILILALATYKSLPKKVNRSVFSLSVLRKISPFAGGMLGISVLSLLLTQTDKILLSKLLSLTEFGYYTLASLLAGALYGLVLPITQAWFPRLTQLHEAGDHAGLVQLFHQGAQLISIIAGSASLVMIFQSETFLRIWTQDVALAERVAPLMRLLALGYFLNILMWIPFENQLAQGKVKLSITINLIAVILFIPAIFTLIPQFGTKGSAWAWIILNAGYVLVGVHFMFRNTLPEEKWRWYIQDIVKPLIISLVLMLVANMFIPVPTELYSQLAVLVSYAVLSLLVSAMSASHVRPIIVRRLLKIRWFNLVK